jgi:hypothetical protein
MRKIRRTRILKSAGTLPDSTGMMLDPATEPEFKLPIRERKSPDFQRISNIYSFHYASPCEISKNQKHNEAHDYEKRRKIGPDEMDGGTRGIAARCLAMPGCASRLKR